MTIIEKTVIIKDLSEALISPTKGELLKICDEVMTIYNNDDNSMYDTLANLGINNVSLEDALHIYAECMRRSDGDKIIRKTPEGDEDVITF